MDGQILSGNFGENTGVESIGILAESSCLSGTRHRRRQPVTDGPAHPTQCLVPRPAAVRLSGCRRASIPSPSYRPQFCARAAQSNTVQKRCAIHLSPRCWPDGSGRTATFRSMRVHRQYSVPCRLRRIGRKERNKQPLASENGIEGGGVQQRRR